MPASWSAADSNSYLFGRIGSHNVVIACLPAGSSGAAPAATVAANMQRTFRDVRVSLLVGIDSGAPSADDDIWLGDIAVGIPTNDTGGVIQFGPVADEDLVVDDGGRSAAPVAAPKAVTAVVVTVASCAHAALTRRRACCCRR